jgi:hypothetical protein
MKANPKANPKSPRHTFIGPRGVGIKKRGVTVWGLLYSQDTELNSYCAWHKDQRVRHRDRKWPLRQRRPWVGDGVNLVR